METSIDRSSIEGLFENCFEGIVVYELSSEVPADPHGRVIFANKSMYRFLGFEPHERDELFASLEYQLFDTASSRSGLCEAEESQFELLTRGGERKRAAIRIRECRIEGRYCVVCTMIPLEWVQNSSGLLPADARGTDQRSLRLLEALQNAAIRMKYAVTPEGIFSTVKAEFRRRGFSCSFYSADEKLENLHAAHLSYHQSAIRFIEMLLGRKVTDFLFPIEANPYLRKVVRERKTLYIDDMENWLVCLLSTTLSEGKARRIGRYLTFIVKKSVSAPLFIGAYSGSPCPYSGNLPERGGRVIGVFSVHSDDLVPADTVPITAFAYQLAADLNKALLLDQARHLTDELKAAKEAAEKANRAKSRFLSLISHEIRTPISGIIGMTDMMIASEAEGDVKKNLLLVRKAEDSLLHVINDVLDLSKIESGSFSLHEEDFCLPDIIKEAMLPIEFSLRARNVALTLRIDEDVPTELFGDGKRLRQVLTNILGNGAKFTTSGSIDMKVSARRREDAIEISFSISDTGVGISPEKLGHIFEPFIQGITYEGEGGGTGLGLTISKHLVERMGGRIWVESTVGKGSTFSFTVVMKEATRSICIDTGEEEFTLSTPLNVLVAEDNHLNQLAIEYMLESEGHRATIVNSGKKVLEELLEHRYDLVLMDVRMPEMDGMEATRLIRSIFPGREIPIIALTAYALKEEEEEFLKAGMDACLVKPVDKERLFKTMQRVMEGHRPGRYNGV
ncbi:MAG TPA: ATP-binding protein, partial [Spirochaetia bacterium]|nr:ATP-binding protein [Spirochaetia bacterium]